MGGVASASVRIRYTTAVTPGGARQAERTRRVRCQVGERDDGTTNTLGRKGASGW